jgi:ribonuclease HII
MSDLNNDVKNTEKEKKKEVKKEKEKEKEKKKEEREKKKEEREKKKEEREKEKKKKKEEKEKNMKPKIVLEHFYKESAQLEIGIDEVGRGPMFGRVYSAAVILPKNSDFRYDLLKDSKKFTSEKKIHEAYDYIKENAVAFAICYEDEIIIDKINIRNATHCSMHKCIKTITNSHNTILDSQLANNNNNDSARYYLLIDGNDFKYYTYMNSENNIIEQINHILIEGGDNKFCSIAAASILAKVERDKYIKEMCEKYPKLDLYYGLENNKGYGTSKHMDGIKKYGISRWHRATYGCCKEADINTDDFYL